MENILRRRFTFGHIIESLVSQKLFGNYTYTIRHGLAAGMKRKGGLGFLPVGHARTAEVIFLQQLPLAGKVVYDIGAFEGIMTLFFARAAKEVISWEPNPRNYARCAENVKLNGLTNVRVLNRGVSDSAGNLELVWHPVIPGASSGNAALKGQMRMSLKSARTVSVPINTVDAEVADGGFPLPDLVKIDIEGMEFQALKGMQTILMKRPPELFIEMHGATSKEKIEIAQNVLEFLEERGYQIFDIEHREKLTRDNLGERRPGHIYCTPLS